MSGIEGRMKPLSEMRRKHLAQLKANCANLVKDKDGSASNSLVGSLRFLAVADYVLHRDIPAFRNQLIEAAHHRVRLFERIDAGEAISPSYVSMMSYKALLNALAAGDQSVARALAALMGGRDAVEQEYDRPFDIALGYTLKSILAGDGIAAMSHVEALESACRDPENQDFMGYAKALKAIVTQDADLLQDGLKEVLAGHKRQSKGSGLFKDTEDEVLCVWGVGLANLARMSGLPVGTDDPLIPGDLLV